MQVKNYPYNKPGKELKAAVKWLNSNQTILKQTVRTELEFPEFWGMPDNLSTNLLEDEINFLKGETFSWWWKNYMNAMHGFNIKEL